MKNWFNKYCKVPISKISCYLYLHDTQDENAARKFWSEATKIPLNQFHKTYVVKSKTLRYRKTHHEYGLLRLSVNNTNLHRKMMGWISGILEV